ncbi:hypothetical protein KY092_15070 [Natronomonas gomsonensis]|uniref:hypothetical protein n=1 Tax=Natronomonas gomsonensis TaxID=1046043 RepID=UPI0020CA9631|nr:hypothetical protein [Natronomonas gomsonensis]MCY4731880.1 hypothetical protein [Natronomonas gomsonensis]
MSSNIDADSLPLVPGALAGVAAWVLGYVFTYLLVSSDLRESGLNQFAQAFGDGDATYELVGWVFFNSHFAETVIDAGFFGDTTSFIGGENGFTALLYVIPVALILASGLAIGRYQGVTDINDGAIAGALVVPGYLILSIVGAFLFRVEAGGASGQPDLLPAIILAGIVYPVVFGAIGGAIASVTAEDDSSGL